jgi:hypothetical protein
MGPAQHRQGPLGDWYAKRYSVAFFNQVCGYTPATDVRLTGLNAVTAPSSTRIIRQSNRLRTISWLRATRSRST